MVKNRFNSILIKQRKLTPAVKKEDRLIAEARKRIELNDNDEEESWEEEIPEVLMERPAEKEQRVEAEEKKEEKPEEPEVEEKKSRIMKKSSGEHESVEAFTGLDGIQPFVREDL